MTFNPQEATQQAQARLVEINEQIEAHKTSVRDATSAIQTLNEERAAVERFVKASQPRAPRGSKKAAAEAASAPPPPPTPSENQPEGGATTAQTAAGAMDATVKTEPSPAAAKTPFQSTVGTPLASASPFKQP